MKPGDTDGTVLVVTATGIPEVDAQVAAEARTAGPLVSVSGDPGKGNVHFLASVRRGPVVISIGTGGAFPALARRLRKEI